jgi:hypothetical protein
LTDLKRSIRDFVFRGLLFESESKIFRAADIRVGADLSSTEEQLLYETLAPFGVQRRNEAIEMARLYAVLHCFENEIRSLIKETLEEKHGADWWETKVPSNVKKNAANRQRDALKDTWLDGAKLDIFGFADFGDLAKIITENWESFQDIITTGQAWLTQRMSELEKARHFVAHNRLLQPTEFQRIYMYISDWNKVIGL